MKEKKMSIPDPSERFSYVVVNGLPLRDEKDQKIPRRNADYMEYPDFAKEHNMEIDINHYLEKTAGLCACFINDNEKYQLPPLHEIMQIKDMDKKKKRMDTYSQKEAVKWLKKYIKSLQ